VERRRNLAEEELAPPPPRLAGPHGSLLLASVLEGAPKRSEAPRNPGPPKVAVGQPSAAHAENKEERVLRHRARSEGSDHAIGVRRPQRLTRSREEPGTCVGSCLGRRPTEQNSLFVIRAPGRAMESYPWTATNILWCSIRANGRSNITGAPRIPMSRPDSATRKQACQNSERRWQDPRLDRIRRSVRRGQERLPRVHRTRSLRRRLIDCLGRSRYIPFRPPATIHEQE
jgi:hypothetical protein